MLQIKRLILHILADLENFQNLAMRLKVFYIFLLILWFTAIIAFRFWYDYNFIKFVVGH